MELLLFAVGLLAFHFGIEATLGFGFVEATLGWFRSSPWYWCLDIASCSSETAPAATPAPAAVLKTKAAFHDGFDGAHVNLMGDGQLLNVC